MTQPSTSTRVAQFAPLALTITLLVAGCAPLNAEPAAAPPSAVQPTRVASQPVVAVESVRDANPNLPAAVVAIDEQGLADLYESVAPSVVAIQVTSGSFDHPAVPGLPEDMPQGGEGSGFVYDDQGHIVTNNHVIEGADKVVVIFHNGLWAEAKVVAADPQSDLAVIKVDAPDGVELTPLPLANPDDLRVGYGVIAIGNPFGFDSTLTTGIVSALGRSFPVGGRYTLPAVIQTDAAINPGNSGGPLLNLNGEVVGVNFAIESPVRGSSGVGFAIPSSILQRVVPALIDEGKFHYPYLGISGTTIDPDIADALQLKSPVLGAYVEQVMDGGPSSQSGLRGAQPSNTEIVGRGGDIITAIDGVPLQSFEDMVGYLITSTEPGQQVTLTVLRDGETLEIPIRLGERPTAEIASAQDNETPTALTSDQALTIARLTVIDQELLAGEITDISVNEDRRDGKDVWVVELGDGEQTARVVIDVQTGDVLEAITLP